MDSNTKGIIFDIKRFAIHDGEGIRTTIFIKGCPLRCPWCHNPEGRLKPIELMWFSTLCVRCGRCVKACPNQALLLTSDRILIDKNACDLNAACVDVCPANAIRLNGQEMTAEQIFEEIKKDQVFYLSKGGVTLSGGEPLSQIDFSMAVLELCKKNGINTTVETCLYANETDVLRAAKLVDHFYVDIKILDDDQHSKAVGVSNEKILSNFKMLCQTGASICVRIPMIPGYTDDDDNIQDIARFVRNTHKGVPIELLNYNPLASNKFDTLNEVYRVQKGAAPFSEQEMTRKRAIVSKILEA